MANAKAMKPNRVIDLGDGVKRTVSLSLNAMAELEIKYGSVEAAFEKVQQGSIAAVRFLLWQCLISEDDDLTERQVGALITVDNLNDIMDAFMSLIEDNNLQATNDAMKPVSSPNRQTLANW